MSELFFDDIQGDEAASECQNCWVDEFQPFDCAPPETSTSNDGNRTTSLPGLELPTQFQPFLKSLEEQGKVERDDGGRVTNFTDNRDGSTSDLTYDKQGRLTGSTSRDRGGLLTAIESVKYNDAANERTTRSVDFKNSPGYAKETVESFDTNGKLKSVGFHSVDNAVTLEFDEKGRETHSNCVDKSDYSREEIKRSFLEGGEIEVSKSIRNITTGDVEVNGKYDTRGNTISPEVTREKDIDGNEISRTERSRGDSGVAVVHYEGGVLNRIASFSPLVSESGCRMSETKFDSKGNPTKVVTASSYPGLQSLPTRISAFNSDGSAGESFEIKYAEQAPGKIDLSTGRGRIESITHRKPDGETETKSYKSDGDNANPWKDLSEATRHLDLKAIPIGRPARIAPATSLHLEEITGRSLDDFKYSARVIS
ncbi:MAG: RHS repeat protein [Cyanobacteria bacterium]|nr:RHS repeat protein [Cyanobacteriota bacterium]